MATSAFLWHVLNFLAPAASVALLLALLARLAHGRQRLLLPWLSMALLNAILGSLVLGFGLVLTGHDGQLATYAVLVLAMGSCQWLLVRRG